MKPILIEGRTILTYDDLREFPEDGQRHELLQGGHVVTPAPGTPHQDVVANLHLILAAHVRKYHLGKVMLSPYDVVLDRATVVEPDLLYVATGHLGRFTERYLDGPPDLAIEVLSETTRDRDLGEKLLTYARHEVPHYWVVDPHGRRLTEFALSGGTLQPVATHEGEAVFTPRAFPRLRLDLSEVWA